MSRTDYTCVFRPVPRIREQIQGSICICVSGPLDWFGESSHATLQLEISSVADSGGNRWALRISSMAGAAGGNKSKTNPERY